MGDWTWLGIVYFKLGATTLKGRERKEFFEGT